jgi:hypothetical protein
VTFAWREHAEALDEYRVAAKCYEDQEPGVGDRLADKLAEGIQYIREWPDAAPPHRGRVRNPLIRNISIG